MQIKAGYTLRYECPQPTPMLLMLNLHPSRRVDLLTPQVLDFSPHAEAWDYTDSFGHVALAWTAAKAGDPGNSAAKQDAEITQNYWVAQPVTFSIPMKSMAEAKEWANSNRIGLSARVVFKLGKVEVDKKLHKVAKVTEKAAGETISIGGGTEDWGAGRLVRVELIGLRVAVDKEKTQLFEKKGDGS